MVWYLVWLLTNSSVQASANDNTTSLTSCNICTLKKEKWELETSDYAVKESHDRIIIHRFVNHSNHLN